MKKIFSFVVVLAAVAMVGCAGNSNKKAAEAEAEAQATEAAVECTEECDSTKVCAEACDSTKAAAAEEVAPVEETK